MTRCTDPVDLWFNRNTGHRMDSWYAYTEATCTVASVLFRTNKFRILPCIWLGALDAFNFRRLPNLRISQQIFPAHRIQRERISNSHIIIPIRDKTGTYAKKVRSTMCCAGERCLICVDLWCVLFFLNNRALDQERKRHYASRNKGTISRAASSCDGAKYWKIRIEPQKSHSRSELRKLKRSSGVWEIPPPSRPPPRLGWIFSTKPSCLVLSIFPVFRSLLIVTLNLWYVLCGSGCTKELVSIRSPTCFALTDSAGRVHFSKMTPAMS